MSLKFDESDLECYPLKKNKATKKIFSGEIAQNRKPDMIISCEIFEEMVRVLQYYLERLKSFEAWVEELGQEVAQSEEKFLLVLKF